MIWAWFDHDPKMNSSSCTRLFAELTCSKDSRQRILCGKIQPSALRLFPKIYPKVAGATNSYIPTSLQLHQIFLLPKKVALQLSQIVVTNETSSTVQGATVALQHHQTLRRDELVSSRFDRTICQCEPDLIWMCRLFHKMQCKTSTGEAT